MKKFFILFYLLTTTVLTQEWQEAGVMPIPVYGGKALVVDSVIYIVGGFYEPLNSGTEFIQQYNPHNGLWHISSNLNYGRYGHIAKNYNDSIIVLGGIKNAENNSEKIEMWNGTKLPYIYDINSNFVRRFASSEIDNDNIYVFGGTSISSVSNFMFCYNIINKEITFIDNYFNHYYPAQQMSVKVNDYIYLFGGVLFGITDNIYRFNITQKLFEELDEDLESPVAGGVAVKVPDKSIYLIGGFNESSLALNQVNIINIDNDEISISGGPSLIHPRSEAMAVLFENYIYVFGGKDEKGSVENKIERLEVITNIRNEEKIIEDYKLQNNYPNPFNPSTTIKYEVPELSFITIKVYDILGNEISTLVNDLFSAGKYQVKFSAKDENAIKLPSGVYIYKLLSLDPFSNSIKFSQSKKMLLVK